MHVIVQLGMNINELHYIFRGMEPYDMLIGLVFFVGRIGNPYIKPYLSKEMVYMYYTGTSHDFW